MLTRVLKFDPGQTFAFSARILCKTNRFRRFPAGFLILWLSTQRLSENCARAERPDFEEQAGQI